MKTLVLGGGVVGVTTAYFLARAGHEVSWTRGEMVDGDVALVSHGHMLRVLTARWLRQPPADGRLYRLDTGTVSTLGSEHDEPVILSWNVPPPGLT